MEVVKRQWPEYPFLYRQGRRVVQVCDKYLCTDDYGNAVFACHFTNRPVHIGEHRMAGAIMPQAKQVYVAAPDSIEAERASRRLFHESEANCNMCRQFERLPYDRAAFAVSGVFHGRCRSGKKVGVFAVSPDDWMGEPCWEPRAD